MILRCWKPEIWRHFMIFGVFSEILAYFRTDNLLLWSHLSIDYQNSFCIVCRIVLPLRWYQLYDSTMLETLDITSFHDFRRINCDILVFAMLWRHLWRHHNFFYFLFFFTPRPFRRYQYHLSTTISSRDSKGGRIAPLPDFNVSFWTRTE